MPEDLSEYLNRMLGPTQEAATPPVKRADIPALARTYAEKHGIDPDIFERQIKQESGFNPFARSPKGARGVAQFMPDTGRRYGLVRDRDFYDTHKSLDAGARHMKDLLDEFDGDYEKALGAYNAGADRVRDGRYKRFSETRNYIATIMGNGIAGGKEDLNSYLARMLPTPPQKAMADRSAPVEHPAYTAAAEEVKRASGGVYDDTKAREFLASKPGQAKYPNLPRTQRTTRQAVNPHFSELQSRIDALTGEIDSLAQNRNKLTAAGFNVDPATLAPIDSAINQRAQERAQLQDHLRQAQSGWLLPNEKIKDEAALDQRLSKLSVMRNELLRRPEQERGPSLALVDHQLRQLSQVKNDIARMRAGGTTSPRVPSEGGRPADRPEDLPWYLKGHAANLLGSGIQSGVAGLGDVILGVEKMAGVTPSEDFPAAIESGKEYAAYSAQRGGEGIIPEFERGIGHLAVDLPVLAAGGLPAMAIMGAGSAAANPQATPLDVGFEAAKQAALGKALHSGAALTLPKRVLLGGTLFGGLTAAEGGTREQVISQALLGGGLGAWGGKRVKAPDGKTYDVVSDNGNTVDLKPVAETPAEASIAKPGEPVPARPSPELASEDLHPVSAALVEKFGLKLPDGYVREGNQYVYKGRAPQGEEIPAPAPQSSTTSAEKSDVSSPSGASPELALSSKMPEPIATPADAGQPRYAYRARDVGEEGIRVTPESHAQASMSEQDVRRVAPSRSAAPQEVVRVDLSKLDPNSYEVIERPGQPSWVRFKNDVPEHLIERTGDVTTLDAQAAAKASPELRQAVESTPLRDIAEKTGLDPRAANKGVNDVIADGVREFSPEAVAVKRALLEGEDNAGGKGAAAGIGEGGNPPKTKFEATLERMGFGSSSASETAMRPGQTSPETSRGDRTRFETTLEGMGLDRDGAPIAKPGERGQGEALSVSAETRAALESHKLPVAEITRAASSKPVASEPEFVRAARARLRQSLVGNQLNSNPLGAFRDTAIVVGYDVIKGTLNKAEWAREMTLRLGRKVKPILDDVWDHLTSGKFGAADVKRRLEQTRLVPSGLVEDVLSGKRPEHIDRIVDFLAEQRKKITDGAMTASDLARAYVMTVASQGADAIKVGTLRAKLAAASVKLDLPDEYATRNKSGEAVIRPEDAMGLWLQSERGQTALESLERGQFDSKAWNEASKVRSAFGDDRLRNRNVFGDQGGDGYHLRNLEKLVPLFNGAKGNPKSIGQLAAKLNGVGIGKTPFMKMLLGFGDSPTIDAVEINTWLTGRGTTRGQAGRNVELARAVKDFAPNNPGLMQVISDRINNRFNELRKKGNVGSDLSKEDFGAVVHHMLWDKMKGTTNPQRAMYEAMKAEPDFVAASRARIRESLTGKRMNSNPLGDIFDHAVVTGWELYQGAKSFAHWSKQMLDEFGDAVKPHLEKIWQQFEGAKTEPGATGSRRVESFPVADIRTDPARFQYKVDHTKTGTSGTFDASAKFDPEQAARDPLQVWRDPEDSKTYVVDGHNRLGLARRDKVESVPVEFIKAETADEARAVGAIRNILKGNGGEKDTTAFLQDAGVSPEQAARLMRDNGIDNSSAPRVVATLARSGDAPDAAPSPKSPGAATRPGAGGESPNAGNGDLAGGKQVAPLRPRQKPLEIVSTLIKSGLLSGVQTSARNLLSTISHLVMEGGPTRAIASMADILVAGRKGPRSITGPSSTAIGRAALESATTGMKEAWQIIRRGMPEEELDRLANSKEISTGSHIGDMIVNFPFRFLTAQDRVMKVYSFREALENRARAEALNEKRAGAISAESVDGLTRSLVNAAKAGARDDLALNAWQDAEIATFNNENKLGENLKHMKREAGQGGRFTLDQAALFVSVPWNVIRRQLDGMGLGFGIEATKAIARKLQGEAFPTLEAQRGFATMAGRLGTGAAVALLGATLKQAGRLTGYNEEGGKPKASILINGRWYRIDLIPPFGAILALGATLQGEMTRELKKGESRASAVIGATAESLIPQHPFARPLRDTVEPVIEAAQKRSFAPLEKTAESLGGRVVPSIVAEVARAGDDKERDTHGAVDAMKARIPGLREQLPAQRDGLGREVERSGLPGVAGGMADVFRSVPDKAATDPITRELQAAGLNLPGLRQGQTETAAHFQKRADQMGRMMQERLTALIDSPAYKDLSPALKKLSLATVRNDAKRDYHEQAKGGRIPTPEASAWNTEVRVAELSAKESLKDNSDYKALRPADRESVNQRIAALFRPAKARRITDVKEGRAELLVITRALEQSIKEIILDVEEGRDDER